MKKTVVSILIAMIALSTFAQTESKTKNEKTPEQAATRHTAKLETELGLSDAQKSKVYTAELERVTKVKAVRAKYADDKKSAHKEVMAINKSFDAAMKTILTAEQLTKWEATKQAAKEKQSNKKEGAGKKK